MDGLLDSKLFKRLTYAGPDTLDLNLVLDLNWDFSLLTRHPVRCLERFEWLQRINAEFIQESSEWQNIGGLSTSCISQVTRIYFFGNPSQLGWYLGTTSPAVALHICRLDQGMDTSDVARYLLGKGFRFHTFSPISSLPQHIPLIDDHDPKRYRPAGYEWTKCDYNSWAGAIKTFLRSGRGRAAYTRGGIVWRIAMDFALPDDVLLGPSDKAR